MARQDLVEQLYRMLEGAVSRRQIAELVDTTFEHIGKVLSEEGRYCQTHFGTFTVHVRSAREGVHPRTREPIQLPESMTVRFKPAARLLEKLGVPP